MINQEQAYLNVGVTGVEDETRRNYFSLFPEEILISVLDSFLINRPMAGKVGGDGFWVHQDEEYLYVAVFDCMGHGHLASMMTRVYTQSLQKAVLLTETGDPGEILMTLHEEIDKKFKNKNTQVGTGADVGLCKINLSVREVQFAGAKMELLHFIGGELETVKPDKMQIGDLFEYKHEYTTKPVSLEDGKRSVFYLSSDGFRDLIGGPDSKKLGRRAVSELLEDVHKRPLIEQKKFLTDFMNNWSGSNMPLDDVMLVGFAL